MKQYMHMLIHSRIIWKSKTMETTYMSFIRDWAEKSMMHSQNIASCSLIKMSKTSTNWHYFSAWMVNEKGKVWKNFYSRLLFVWDGRGDKNVCVCVCVCHVHVYFCKKERNTFFFVKRRETEKRNQKLMKNVTYTDWMAYVREQEW